MGRRIVLVRHGDGPEEDRVAQWCDAAGFVVDSRKPFKGDLLGRPDTDIAATVVYGGPYEVYETRRYPFLHEEYRWIEDCLAANIPMLGICQGAQMIAHHLGARVGPQDPEFYEFGYYEISPTGEAHGFLDGPLTVCQAHTHGFDLPEGAVRLATGENYPNQAFRYGNLAYGVQFHPEVTAAMFRTWQSQNADSFGRHGVQPRHEQDASMARHDAATAAWFHGFLDRFIGRPT
ncbi:glutamine amidotransferase [Sulfitobacter sp. LCG007]